jgi:hypothetical protein
MIDDDDDPTACNTGGPEMERSARQFVRDTMLGTDAGAGLVRLMKYHQSLGGKRTEREVLRGYLTDEEIEEYLKRNNLTF